ncbi:hypothetical protein NA56DRAFT_648115 [Hyaloscypha hepaticicola]|uniref:Uncharacterized protein n=1 Tax=Hyaloscypha hepaticicola TaxID=2082293 RepID=A0A2J6PWQ6_9HELO|nr:hypothetical protein NA56DRAFT_648115 [Hyaloscypha hepaticicola]
MAPPTRNNPFRTPSPEPLANCEATTRRKCKFFDTLARDSGTKSLRRITKDYYIIDLGAEAKRRTRPRSSILGYKSKITKTTCKILYSPSRNPVRK